MRFKLDENMPAQLRDLLTGSGHDAVTVLDQGMGGATDSDVASACLSEGRILVTQDTGFTDIRTYPPRRHPGIVVIRLASQTRDNLLRVGESFIEALSNSSPQGQLWIVEDSRLRIRE